MGMNQMQPARYPQTGEQLDQNGYSKEKEM